MNQKVVQATLPFSATATGNVHAFGVHFPALLSIFLFSGLILREQGSHSYYRYLALVVEALQLSFLV